MGEKNINCDIDKSYAELLEQNELINIHSSRYKISQIKININNLHKLFSNNFILEKNILNKILIYIYIIPYRSTINYELFLREIYNNEKIIDKTISTKTVGEDFIDKIFEINKYLLDNYLDSLSVELIYFIISNKMHKKIIDYILEKETIDGKIFCSCFYKTYYTNSRYNYDKKNFLDKFQKKKINICEDNIKYLESQIDSYEFLVEYFIENKIKIPESIITNSIMYKNLSFIQKLNYDKNILNYDYLNISCQYTKDDIIEYILNNNIKPTNDTLGIYITNLKLYHNNNYNKIINKLVLNGCILTYDHVLTLTKKKLEIDNIEKYNIKFKDDYIYVCSQYKFYPYKHLIKMSQTSFEILCKNITSISDFKKIVSENKLNITIECLENICFYGNITIVNFILNKGLALNTKCIKNLLICPNKYYFSTHIEKYIDNLEKKNKELEKKINTIEEKQYIEEKKKNYEIIINNDIKLTRKDKNNSKNLNLDYLTKIPKDFNYKENIKIDNNSEFFILLKKNNISFIDYRKIFVKYLLLNILITQKDIIIDNKIYSILNKNNDILNKKNYTIEFCNLDILLYNILIKSI